MAKLQAILDALETVAPKRFAFEFDHIGLQIGDPTDEIERAVVSLDRSVAAIDHAERAGAQLLLAHHPLIWNPLKSLVEANHGERSATKLIRAGITFIAAHTNWDCAKGGINDVLAALLGLDDIESFGAASPVPMLKLIGFAPGGAIEKIVDAASTAGAGWMGEYSRCAFMTQGTGTFKGSVDSKPAVGMAGHREEVQEIRFEMVLRVAQAQAVLSAVRATHPYEEPALDLIPLIPQNEQPIGRIGRLAKPMRIATFVQHLDAKLQSKALTWARPDKVVSKVAVIGGAADNEWPSALAAGADAFVTGEVRQDTAVEASESGIAIIAAGHYATEHPGCIELRRRMEAACPEVDWLLFEPKPGEGGRPI